MKGRNLDTWIRVSSTLAVLIGVALVVIELRQTSDLVELQILKQDSDKYIENALAVLPDNIYEIRQKSMENPRDLTHLEFRALDSLYWTINVAQWRGLYDLSERGLVDKIAWKRMIEEEAPVYLGYPFGRAWWNHTKNITTTLPEDFMLAIDTALAGNRGNYSAAAFQDVMELLNAEYE